MAELKGLVLAGGSGTRLRPLTHTGAKQLVPVANRPILFYVIDNLVHAGVRDIIVVVSPESAAEVQGALGDGQAFGASLRYVVQDRPAGLAHAVLCARKWLEGHDFCMFLGDNLVGSRIDQAAAAFRARPELAASLLLKEVDDPRAFGVAEVSSDGRVLSLEEKPKQPKSNLALVGIYFFRTSVFSAIEATKPSARGELEITDAISQLIARGDLVHYAKVDSWWLDTGKKDDLLLANATVLDDWLQPAQLGEVDAESKISGRVRIEPGAKIIRSMIRGPVVIGRDAQVIDAHIGPFSSIGDEVRIERSRVEHSVILRQSRVIGVSRLEDSLLGRRVHVHPGRDRHGALSLMVGDDCSIELDSR